MFASIGAVSLSPGGNLLGSEKKGFNYHLHYCRRDSIKESLTVIFQRSAPQSMRVQKVKSCNGVIYRPVIRFSSRQLVGAANIDHIINWDFVINWGLLLILFWKTVGKQGYGAIKIKQGLCDSRRKISLMES